MSAISKPPAAGASSRTKFMPAALSEMAFIMPWRPITSGTIACEAGSIIACTTPCTIEVMKRCS
ncbi:MAG: hypothetical protein F4Z08_01200 [Chloroflexi bacterium]|nr:hypothetical protein [Chloroflexota bacterium]